MDQKIQIERQNCTNCLQNFNNLITNNNQFNCQVCFTAFRRGLRLFIARVKKVYLTNFS